MVSTGGVPEADAGRERRGRGGGARREPGKTAITGETNRTAGSETVTVQVIRMYRCKSNR